MKFDRSIHNAAIHLIQDAAKYYVDNTRFEVKSKTTNSFEKFKKEVVNGNFYVSGEGCDNTIYDTPYNNILARVWHDKVHLREDLDFSLESEIAVCNIQVKELQEYGSTYPYKVVELATRLLNADIIGQAVYYDAYKEFVEHQEAFVLDRVYNTRM